MSLKKFGIVAASIVGVSTLALCIGVAAMGAEEETKRAYNKRRAVVIITLSALVVFGGFVAFMLNAQSRKDELVASEAIVMTERGTMAWVNAFVKHDLATCDTLVDNQNLRFYSPLVITNSQDSRYYDRSIKAAIDCVDSISLLSVQGDEYKFIIKLTPYQPLESVIPLNTLELKTKYLNKQLTDSAFIDALKQEYFDIFTSECFRKGEGTVECVAVLNEAEVNGVVYVFGTSDFFDLILQESGIKANVSLFESSIQDEVDKVLKSGFD